MKIAHIKISNILGHETFELDAGGSLTEISGPNDSGKTSILEAIRAAVGAGHDATLLRKGAAKGETILVFDDGVELHHTVTASGSVRNLVVDGKKIKQPASTIKGMTDLLSVNPIDFLTAPQKDRVKVLLESMPITIDTERLEAMTRVAVDKKSATDGLHIIEAVRRQVYDDRTGTNRAVTEKEATINQLELAMPDAPAGAEGNEQELRDQMQLLIAGRDTETLRIDTKLAQMKEASHGKIAEIRAAAQEEIDKIKEAAEAASAAEREAYAGNEHKAARVKQKVVDTCLEAVAPIRATVDAIVANRSAYAKREQTQATIEKMRQELKDLRKDADAQNKAIADVDAYKAELLAGLPIPGLEVKDGDIYFGGVLFDRLNTAQQVQIAIDIAKLRAGDLAIACIDRFEALDPKAFEAFRQRAETSGLQLFVTRVTGDKFSVKTQ